MKFKLMKKKKNFLCKQLCITMNKKKNKYFEEYICNKAVKGQLIRGKRKKKYIF